MAYTNIDLDIGVALLGSGYRVDWGDVNTPYWLPVPEAVINQDLYVVDWETVGTVRKFKPDNLSLITRSGSFLDKAFSTLENHVRKKGQILSIAWCINKSSHKATASRQKERLSSC